MNVPFSFKYYLSLGLLQFSTEIEKLSCNPLNSKCVCPAGKRPNVTCEHIAAIMLMLESLAHTEEIQIEKTCTQDFQTFHKLRSLQW